MWRWDMHGTTWANGSALSTHRFWVSSTWICLFLHANEFKFKCSSLFLVVLESMVGSVEFWNRFDKLWLQLNHDPAGHCTKPQLSQREGKEYMTNLTRTRYLMGNLYAAATAIKHGGLWCSVLIELVSFGLQRMKSLGCCSCSSGLVPCLPCKSLKLSTQPLPFHSNLWTPWEIIFQRCCGFPLDYCAPSVSSCAGVASVLARAAV